MVQASNFAPGTTAADIEAAVQAVATDSTGNNGLLTCRILSNNPTVMAEMVFSERYIADRVVETFNNQKADGRILYVYLKQGSPSPALRRKKSEPALTVPETMPTGPSKDLFDATIVPPEDVEMATEPSYNDAREVANRDRQNRESGRAEPDVQDGRYGFTNGREQNEVKEKPREVVPPRDEADQRMDSESTTQRHAEGRDRRYDNRYSDRTDERSSYRRDDRYGDFRRDDRHPRYGNGAGGRGYGGGDSYGRMYSDDMRGPPRGSSRVDPGVATDDTRTTDWREAPKRLRCGISCVL